MQVMQQIDLLLSARKKEQDGKMQRVKDQLQARERELSTLRVALQERTQKVSTCVFRVSYSIHVCSSDCEFYCYR